MDSPPAGWYPQRRAGPNRQVHLFVRLRSALAPADWRGPAADVFDDLPRRLRGDDRTRYLGEQVRTPPAEPDRLPCPSVDEYETERSSDVVTCLRCPSGELRRLLGATWTGNGSSYVAAEELVIQNPCPTGEPAPSLLISARAADRLQSLGVQLVWRLEVADLRASTWPREDHVVHWPPTE